MKIEFEKLETTLPATELDYVRIEEQLDGRLSVFVRELHDQSPRRQFQVEFHDYGAFRVTGEHVSHALADNGAFGNLFIVLNSPWIREVGLEADSVYGRIKGYLHSVIFTASFTVDVASSTKPVVREVAPLSDEEFNQLTKGPTNHSSGTREPVAGSLDAQ
jgi:hypothetical protein